ncbi:MAG TPA: hypothetical protein VN962_13160, partial [Polyangia bacterium]|nr:hypothetical protein [Polyangia bacterium]
MVLCGVAVGCGLREQPEVPDAAFIKTGTGGAAGAVAGGAGHAGGGGGRGGASGQGGVAGRGGGPGGTGGTSTGGHQGTVDAGPDGPACTPNVACTP